jgi:hypothetical protein
MYQLLILFLKGSANMWMLPAAVVMEARNVKPAHQMHLNTTQQLETYSSKHLTMNPLPYVVVAPKLHKNSAIVVPSILSPKPNNDKALALAVTITLAFIIAIGLPVAAIIPQKYIDKLPINILVPLYIDPDRGAWDRIYEW